MAGRSGILLYNDIHNPEKSLHLTDLSYFNESERANTEQEPRWRLIRWKSEGDSLSEMVWGSRKTRPTPPSSTSFVKLIFLQNIFKKTFFLIHGIHLAVLFHGGMQIYLHTTPKHCRSQQYAGVEQDVKLVSSHAHKMMNVPFLYKKQTVPPKSSPVSKTPCQGLCIWN